MGYEIRKLGFFRHTSGPCIVCLAANVLTATAVPLYKVVYLTDDLYADTHVIDSRLCRTHAEQRWAERHLALMQHRREERERALQERRERIPEFRPNGARMHARDESQPESAVDPDARRIIT